MKIRRSIELEFDTGCGDQTAAAIVASCLAVAEGRLAQECTRGRVDTYDIRVTRPVEEEVRSA